MSLPSSPRSAEPVDSEPSLALSPPHVDAVGVVHYPAGFSGRARTYSTSARVFVWTLLVFFFVVLVASTTASLGAYCLTSDGGDTRALRSSPFFDPAPEDRSRD